MLFERRFLHKLAWDQVADLNAMNGNVDTGGGNPEVYGPPTYIKERQAEATRIHDADVARRNKEFDAEHPDVNPYIKDIPFIGKYFAHKIQQGNSLGDAIWLKGANNRTPGAEAVREGLNFGANLIHPKNLLSSLSNIFVRGPAAIAGEALGNVAPDDGAQEVINNITFDPTHPVLVPGASPVSGELGQEANTALVGYGLSKLPGAIRRAQAATHPKTALARRAFDPMTVLRKDKLAPAPVARHSFLKDRIKNNYTNAGFFDAVSGAKFGTSKFENWLRGTLHNVSKKLPSHAPLFNDLKQIAPLYWLMPTVRRAK